MKLFTKSNYKPKCKYNEKEILEHLYVFTMELLAAQKNQTTKDGQNSQCLVGVWNSCLHKFDVKNGTYYGSFQNALKNLNQVISSNANFINDLVNCYVHQDKVNMKELNQLPIAQVVIFLDISKNFKIDPRNLLRLIKKHHDNYVVLYEACENASKQNEINHVVPFKIN